jgi:hypothetical protein
MIYLFNIQIKPKQIEQCFHGNVINSDSRNIYFSENLVQNLYKALM